MLFSKKLEKLCKKHQILLYGKIRVLDKDTHLPDSQNIEFAEFIQVDDKTRDMMGPFLILTADIKPHEPAMFKKKRFSSNLLNMDKDKLLKDGVKSVIDGSIHTNRQTYAEHLKKHNCTEVGNDYNNAKPKAEANYEFDDSGIEEATARAVQEVAERRNIKSLR